MGVDVGTGTGTGKGMVRDADVRKGLGKASEWDDREQGALQAAHRAKLRELSEARQAAERRRKLACRSGAANREEADATLRAELARLADEHAAWQRVHGLIEDPPGSRRPPRLKGGAKR